MKYTPEEFPGSIAWRRRLGFWDDARWARRQYVVQLEKSILQRCDTKCCHTNVVADPTIIECDEHLILWGKMFE